MIEEKIKTTVGKAFSKESAVYRKITFRQIDSQIDDCLVLVHNINIRYICSYELVPVLAYK